MPSHLHGLNIIRASQSDLSSQDLLSGPFPDLSLWTHLPFETEDGSNPMLLSDSGYNQSVEEDDKLGKGKGLELEASAIHSGHVNVVTGINQSEYLSPIPTAAPPMPSPSINVAGLLSSFGINPHIFAQQLQPQGTPSLAQLLTIHAAQSQSAVQPVANLSTPPSKRQRTRRDSAGEQSSDSPTSKTPLSGSEDKRRRNTAASARFRLKKKEREIAMETKAKGLELRVSELERECEGLRRENGWLKGLVVGVTGGAAPNPSTRSKRSREEVVP
ncbi:hypothetical protein D9757_008216 [Collybiopsis confluens]|uniref:BZIP domain-containing protein n=1 Tax=Collybiopsis confluens TaxID=2823264 RepID=A0A8H5HBG9_9AGAR|nr:hypothetical protein D9757_008216 [Collybiopsis confluens]